MNRFLKRIIAFLISLMVLGFVAAVVGDPFNVFHYRRIRDNSIEPNRNYIKTRYLLDNPGLFDTYLFGNSCAGFINVANIPELRCYNMFYPYGIPSEHYQNLKVLLRRNIIPGTILLGIDDAVCYIKPEEHYNELMLIPFPVEAPENRLAHLRFFARYININTVQSLPTVADNIIKKKVDRGGGGSINYRKHFYGNGGWTIHDIEKFESKTGYWETAMGGSRPFSYGIANALQDVQSIIDLCREHNIRLILFTNPLHKMTYQQAVEYGYLDFLSQLAEITDFYNFSGLNDITINNDNYYETSHYKFSVGDLIVDALFNGTTDERLATQGFGRYVTSDTKAEFLELLNNQLNQTAIAVTEP